MSHNPQIDAATAMMIAADLMEQGRFDFFQTKARFCEGLGGCPGAWIAYVLGLEDADTAFEWLGVGDLLGFDAAMRAAVGTTKWTLDPTLAATGLRKLAQERMK